MSINLAIVPPAAEVVNDEAETVANKLNQAPWRINKGTQICHFYDELIGRQGRINGDNEKFRQYEAFIKMFNAKVAYAKGRKLVDEQFEYWFREGIKFTTSAKALGRFCLHFGAVIGFLKALWG